MYAVARVLDWTHPLGATRSREVVDEFARWTADELDYLVEARQAALLYEQARGERRERIARVYREYTTSRVLTSELIDGIPLIEIVSAVRQGNEAYLRDLAERGYDLQAVVRHLDWNMLNQVYVFGCFHADLHPANLFVLPGNAIGYVDFGDHRPAPGGGARLADPLQLAPLPGGPRGGHPGADALAGARLGDRRRQRPAAARAHPPGLPLRPRPRRLRRHRSRGPLPGGDGEPGGAENPYSRLAVDVMQTVRRYDLTLAPGVVAYLKMLVTLGALRHQLAPDYDLPSLARRFFVRLLQQQGASWLDPRHGPRPGLRRQLSACGRALEFVELLEAQAPLITAAGEHLLRRAPAACRRVRRRVIAPGRAPRWWSGPPCTSCWRTRTAPAPSSPPRSPTPGCTSGCWPSWCS